MTNVYLQGLFVQLSRDMTIEGKVFKKNTLLMVEDKEGAYNLINAKGDAVYSDCVELSEYGTVLDLSQGLTISLTHGRYIDADFNLIYDLAIAAS